MPDFSECRGVVGPMTTGPTKRGRPSLGPRHVLLTPIPAPVRDRLDALAQRVRTDGSTVLADLACSAVGRPELARVIRFDTSADYESAGVAAPTAPRLRGSRGRYVPMPPPATPTYSVTTRVPIPVRDAIDAVARYTNTSRAIFLADLASCAVGLPHLAQHLRFDTQGVRPIPANEGLEVLPLAI